MRIRVTPPLLHDAEVKIAKTLTRNVDRGREAMLEAAEYLLETALIIAPEKDGDLRGSGRIEEDFDGLVDSVSVVFGDASVDYAEAHEHWHSDEYLNPTTDDTFPHYLARALDDIGGSSWITRHVAMAVGRK